MLGRFNTWQEGFFSSSTNRHFVLPQLHLPPYSLCLPAARARTHIHTRTTCSMLCTSTRIVRANTVAHILRMHCNAARPLPRAAPFWRGCALRARCRCALSCAAHALRLYLLLLPPSPTTLPSTTLSHPIPPPSTPTVVLSYCPPP